MNLRKRKTQLFWWGQLLALCLMLSTPFWLREDFPVLQPVLKNFSSSDLAASTLEPSAILEIDFDRLGIDQILTVSSRQLRISSPLKGAPKNSAQRSLASSDQSRVITTKGETWWLEKVEKISPRVPAAESSQWVTVHAPDEEHRVSEYFEIGEGSTRLVLHFASSSKKSVKKTISLKYQGLEK